MSMKENLIIEIQEKLKIWLSSEEGKACIFNKYLIYAPMILDLLVKLSFDNSLNSNDISKITSAIKYFNSAYDLFPEEFLGIPGYLDDISVSAFVISNISNEYNNPIIKKHWSGDCDIFILVNQILNDADDIMAT